MKKQRILAALLALVMVVGLLPTAALAARIDDEALALDAPADEAVEPVAAEPMDVPDGGAELLETTADAAGSVVGTAYSSDPNAYEIYPVPHSINYSTGGVFQISDEVNIVKGKDVDDYTVNFVKEILEKYDHTVTDALAPAPDKTNIILAVHDAETPTNDPVAPTAVADLWTAADKYDSYLLKAEGGTSSNPKGTVTIIGKDADAVYYGAATLQMMFTSFNGQKFLNATIEDYSNTIFRGFIEGFYGGFNYDQRKSQMRSLRDVKGNMYVYSSKDDSYHAGGNWATLYPDDELAKIKELVDLGKTIKVDYAWSVHLGFGGNVLGGNGGTITDDQYAENLQKLKDKFEQLYNIGVRNFSILNDDIPSGVHARQIQLLNDMNAWLKEKDCGPLIYCCSGYNIAWAGSGSELTDLRGLNDDIYLYWTGSDVNSPITQANTDWAYTRSGQPIVTWINYPCSEHCGKRGVFLGDISHYVEDANGLKNHYGLLANPMDWAEANKVAYFQLLSWAWNRDNYTSYLPDLWEDSFKYLQPEVAGAYRTIARNVANCPQSGRVPEGFPESEYLKDKLDAVQAAALAGQTIQADALLTDLSGILAAVAAFRSGCTNEALKTELEPWLKSLESVVNAAIKSIQAVTLLKTSDTSNTWNLFSQGAVALDQWDDFTSRDNGGATGVRLAGSKRLQPFAEAMLNYVKTSMAQEFNPGGGLGGGVVPMVKMGGNIQTNNDNARKMLDGSPSSYATYQIVQKADDYVGVNLGKVELIQSIDILQGQNDTHHDYFHDATVEYSVDGETWTPLVRKINAHHIYMDGLNLAARYVRLRLLTEGYNGKPDYHTYIREFTVTTKQEGLVYTGLADIPDGVTAQEDGGIYTLTIPSLTLPAGGYVGLRLPEIMGIQTVTTTGTLPGDVKLQFSASGTVWVDGAPSETTPMGYIRLYNSGSGDVALTNATLTASVPIRTHLTHVSNSGVSIHNGSWDAVVDGDRQTIVYTGERQAYGQYAIFDLGAKQAVKDVTVYVPDSGDDIPHNLDILISDTSDPNGAWESIGQLRGDGYARVEPQPYRFFECNGNGKTARYIKLAIANVEARNWFRINELEVNTTVPQDDPLTAVSSTSGEAANADDGDLLTFLTPDAGAGHWEKLLQDPTTYTSLTVLRGTAGATAHAWVQKRDGSGVDLGPLDATAKTLSLPSEPITSVQITWKAGDEPSIAEVILAGEAAPSGDDYTLRPNIYEKPDDPAEVTVPNGTELAKVGLPATVRAVMSDGTTASVGVTWSCADYAPTTAGNYTFTGALGDTHFNPGCFTLSATVIVEPAQTGDTPNLALSRNAYASGWESGDNGPAKAVDGESSIDSRWVGNYMKHFATNPSWIVVDLGPNVETISSITMDYHMKVWPVSYKIQVAGSDFTPVDYSDKNGAGGGEMDADTFAGNNAEDAACWKTLKTVTGLSGLSDNPTLTVNSADFDISLPAGSRYLRIYYKEMNPAAAGHAISLKELTVAGTRGESSQEPDPEEVDTSALETAIADATKAMEGITAYDDDRAPTEVDQGTKYTTNAAMGALNTAITAAEGVLNDADATQEDVNAAVAALGEAVTTFNAAVKTGAKETSTTPPSPNRPSTSTPSSSTSTQVKEDGTKVTIVTDNRTGTVTETVTAPDGAKSETVTTKDGDVTITVTDPEGEELAKVELPAAIPETETKFDDVDATPWAEEAIHKMAGLELVNGTGGNKYSPTAPMTRGSLATVLHRLSQGKTDYATTFKDVAVGKFYTEGVAWAAKVNVVKGVSDDVFAPDQVITREQLATMLARYAKLIGLDTKADAKSLEAFSDGENTGVWAVDGVAWCVEQGILKGKGQNDLDPTADVSRAEVAVMLDRFISLLK